MSICKPPGRCSCHLAGKPPSSCPHPAPTQGPCPQLCPTPLLLTLGPHPFHCGVQDPGQGAERTLCKCSQASPEAGGLRGSSVRSQGALGEGQGLACLRSRWSLSVPSPATMECKACPGRYFGCTLSHPRPLELRPCILHAMTMTTTSNCFLQEGGGEHCLGKGGGWGKCF